MATQPITPPQLFVLAGPNGAGKSTTARTLLPGTLGVDQFVNADNIAAGLSPFAPGSAAIDAGRLMVERISTLLDRGASLGMESTLAGRSTAAVLRDALRRGYRVHLIFVWLRSPALAVERVADRVAHGGHSVPNEVVVRRYHRGLLNFNRLYRPLATTWTPCDNSEARIRVIAQGKGMTVMQVLDHDRLRLVDESIKRARSAV